MSIFEIIWIILNYLPYLLRNDFKENNIIEIKIILSLTDSCYTAIYFILSVFSY